MMPCAINSRVHVVRLLDPVSRQLQYCLSQVCVCVCVRAHVCVCAYVCATSGTPSVRLEVCFCAVKHLCTSQACSPRAWKCAVARAVGATPSR